MTRFPRIHGGTTAVVSLKHDETSQNGRISLVDSWKTGHSNDPSIWPALKKTSREIAKVDTLVSCVFGMGEHGGSSMPFGWAGDAAWGATLSTTRRASTYTGSAAAGGRKGVREKSVPAFDGRYPGMPCAVWDTRIAPVPCPIARHQETSEKKTVILGNFRLLFHSFPIDFFMYRIPGSRTADSGRAPPAGSFGENCHKLAEIFTGARHTVNSAPEGMVGGAPLYSRYLRTQDKCF